MSTSTSYPKRIPRVPDGRGGAADPVVARLLAEADCPYEPGALLGQGAMARVYLGVHRESGRVAAIKIPTGSPWAHQRFRQEVDAMVRFDHPHLMAIIEADPARRWYAMPLARRSLGELYRLDPFDLPALRKALSSVTGAMMHAHASGCIHRDASPGNVLELGAGHWVLSDFGIAKAPLGLSRGTEHGEHFGTPHFSAPEVHLDPAAASPAADAWSIGALAMWFTAIRHGQAPGSLQGRAWLALIEGTVCHDPAERWSLSRVAMHLDALSAARVEIRPAWEAPDACFHCHAAAGRDGAERCRNCGFVADA